MLPNSDPIYERIAIGNSPAMLVKMPKHQETPWPPGSDKPPPGSMPIQRSFDTGIYIPAYEKGTVPLGDFETGSMTEQEESSLTHSRTGPNMSGGSIADRRQQLLTSDVYDMAIDAWEEDEDIWYYEKADKTNNSVVGAANLDNKKLDEAQLTNYIPFPHDRDDLTAPEGPPILQARQDSYKKGGWIPISNAFCFNNPNEFFISRYSTQSIRVTNNDLPQPFIFGECVNIKTYEYLALKFRLTKWSQADFAGRAMWEWREKVFENEGSYGEPAWKKAKMSLPILMPHNDKMNKNQDGSEVDGDGGAMSSPPRESTTVTPPVTPAPTDPRSRRVDFNNNLC
ncbi:MAG: hypothetical protein K0U52_00290 [Gammaproteobacteria bacterium]|nr:hypothetical protein [Gammaproteobacteria bacterium]